MRVLLDTNIIIYRESLTASNYTIGELFYWLDKLHCVKLIHPYSVEELKSANNEAQQAIYDARLGAYTRMQTVASQTDEFKAKLEGYASTTNDFVDNQLLYEVYCNRADILITEDRRMRNKALHLGISSRVFSINSFITKCVSEYPALIDYKVLSVKKEIIGSIDSKDPFFDSLRKDYDGFDEWFSKKCDEEAYVCRSDKKILGFLYLKIEGPDENYSDIVPTFSTCKRLKVGTFKVDSTGFRLGERFIQIIFDNAIRQQAAEIYVTLFNNRPELDALNALLERWGFVHYGIKRHAVENETVLVKRLGVYDENKSVKQNFPNIKSKHRVYFLPIEAAYHTRLFPDSILRTENGINILENKPEQYSLQKVYISFSFKKEMRPGDILAIYRKGITTGRKAFESVVTTVCVIDEVKWDFQSMDEYLEYCENRTVFSKDELKNFWNRTKGKLLVLKIIFVKSLAHNIILKDLWEMGLVKPPGGPRPFDTISERAFQQLLDASNTLIYTGNETSVINKT